MKEFKPFFMHSCLCLDDTSIESYDSLMEATGYNTGNSYITYGLLKATYDKSLSELKHIQNMFFYDFSNCFFIFNYFKRWCSYEIL